MKPTVQHIQIPVRIEDRKEKLDIDYDIVSLARTAIKMKLLAELDELESSSS